MVAVLMEEEEGMHHKCSSSSMKQYKVNDQ
jgi:hypothetical protein